MHTNFTLFSEIVAIIRKQLSIDLNDAFIIITPRPRASPYTYTCPCTCSLPHASQLTFKTRAKRCQLHSSWEHVTCEEELHSSSSVAPVATIRLFINGPLIPFLSVLHVRVRISINNCRHRIVVITFGRVLDSRYSILDLYCLLFMHRCINICIYTLNRSI